MVKVREDLTGKKFGKLIVIQQAEDYIGPTGQHYAQWLCMCECSAKQVIVRGADLKNGHTTSCGCAHKEVMAKKLIDLTGKQYGRLMVLERADDYVDKNGRHIPQWLCQCSCTDHRIIVVRGSDLKSGKTQSCGCLNMERIKKYNQYTKCHDEYGDYYIGRTSNTNTEFYVDADDYDSIKNYCWCEIVHNGYHYLAAWNIGSSGNILMTHLLFGKNYDHIDRNPLNNRRHNVRKSTIAQNSTNCTIPKNNTSGVIGVHFDKRSNKWVARIDDDLNHRIIVYKGNNKYDAIVARLNAELLYYREFAPQVHLFEQYNIVNPNIEMKEIL